MGRSLRRWQVLASQCTFHAHLKLRRAVGRARAFLTTAEGHATPPLHAIHNGPVSAMDGPFFDPWASAETQHAGNHGAAPASVPAEAATASSAFGTAVADDGTDDGVAGSDTASALLRTLSRYGQVRYCDAILERLEERGQRPSLKQLHAVAAAHARAGDVEGTRTLVDRACCEFGASEHSIHLGLLAHVRAEPEPRMAEAEEFLEQQQLHKHLPPNMLTFATLIEGYGRLGPSPTAVDGIHCTLQRIRQQQATLSTTAMQKLCEAFVRTRQLDEARALISSATARKTPLPHSTVRSLFAAHFDNNDLPGFLRLAEHLDNASLHDKFDIAVLAHRLMLRHELGGCTSALAGVGDAAKGAGGGKRRVLSAQELERMVGKSEEDLGLGVDRSNRQVALLRACAEEQLVEEAMALYQAWFEDNHVKHNGVLASLMRMWLDPLLWSSQQHHHRHRLHSPPHNPQKERQQHRSQQGNCSASAVPTAAPHDRHGQDVVEPGALGQGGQRDREHDWRNAARGTLHGAAGATPQATAPTLEHDDVYFTADGGECSRDDLVRGWLGSQGGLNLTHLEEAIDTSALVAPHATATVEQRVAEAEALFEQLDLSRITSYHVHPLSQWYMQIGAADRVGELLALLYQHARAQVPSGSNISLVKARVVAGDAAGAAHALLHMENSGHPVFPELRAFVDAFHHLARHP